MRYRFRRGLTEFEIEHSGDIPDEQQKVLTSLLETFSGLLQEEAVSEPVTGGNSPAPVNAEDRRDCRGGQRKAFISPALDRLIERKWLVEKNMPEVVAQLKADGVPGEGHQAVAGRPLAGKVRTPSGRKWLTSSPKA